MRMLLLTCSLLAGSLLAGSLLVGAAHAQDLRLEASVLSSAGGTATVGGFTLTSTVGQSAPVGRVESGSYVLFSGYPSPFFGAVAVVVTYTPPAEPQAPGEAVTVRAQIEGREARIESVTLQYRSGAAEMFSEEPMELVDGAYEATIPGDVIGETGVAYRIVAVDQADPPNTVVRPAVGTFSFPIRIEGNGLTRARGLPSGNTQAAYRLVSVPLRLDDASPATVLGDDISALAGGGAYDPSRARFFEPRGETVAEFPRTRPMVPGRAFWLIVRDGASGFDTGPGEVLALDGPFELNLEAGWNFVANPFNVSIPVENLRLGSGADVVLRSYTGDYNALTNPVTTMQPFTGYALFAEADDVLIIDPVSSPTPPAGAAQQRVAGAPALQWSIRMFARGDGGRDGDNVAAVASSAADGQGTMDWPEPPTPFSGLDAYFTHPEWSAATDRFSSDTRPTLDEGAVWPLQVAADGQVTLSFEGVAKVPAGFEVWLVHEELAVAQDLREAPRYELTAEAGAPQSLQLVVGTPAFARTQLERAGALPDAFSLSPAFPNPSRGLVRLRYGLPEASPVTIQVYNILGQRVRTLIDGERTPAGQHLLSWDGRNGRGVPVASGLYLVRIQAGDFTTTRKVMILR